MLILGNKNKQKYIELILSKWAEGESENPELGIAFACISPVDIKRIENINYLFGTLDAITFAEEVVYPFLCEYFKQYRSNVDHHILTLVLECGGTCPPDIFE